MFRRIKKILSDHNKMVRRTAGLKEKEAGIQAKLDAAYAILNEKRKEDIPVEFDRRVRTA